MADLAAIRDAIAATLNAVNDVGKVYTYERYADHKSAFEALYKYNGQIRGWFIRRVRTRETGDGEIDGFGFEYHRWQIRGFMSLQDSTQSELVFDALIEDVRAAFRADHTLGGAVSSLQDGAETSIQVVDSGPVILGGTLCHSCRLELTTQSLIEPQYGG